MSSSAVGGSLNVCPVARTVTGSENTFSKAFRAFLISLFAAFSPRRPLVSIVHCTLTGPSLSIAYSGLPVILCLQSAS